MSCHEFAIFVGVLAGNEEARVALLRSGTNLFRIEQQRCYGRDELRDSIVAQLQNDEQANAGRS